MKCSLAVSEDVATLAVSGAMTIEDAAEMKTTLANALSGSSRMKIDLKEVEDIDLSCLQILCSVHRTAIEGGKELVIQGTTETVVACIENAGFLRHIGCLSQRGVPCLWQDRT